MSFFGADFWIKTANEENVNRNISNEIVFIK